MRRWKRHQGWDQSQPAPQACPAPGHQGGAESHRLRNRVPTWPPPVGHLPSLVPNQSCGTLTHRGYHSTARTHTEPLLQPQGVSPGVSQMDLSHDPVTVHTRTYTHTTYPCSYHTHIHMNTLTCAMYTTHTTHMPYSHHTLTHTYHTSACTHTYHTHTPTPHIYIAHIHKCTHTRHTHIHPIYVHTHAQHTYTHSHKSYTTPKHECIALAGLFSWVSQPSSTLASPPSCLTLCLCLPLPGPPPCSELSSPFGRPPPHCYHSHNPEGWPHKSELQGWVWKTRPSLCSWAAPGRSSRQNGVAPATAVRNTL